MKKEAKTRRMKVYDKIMRRGGDGLYSYHVLFPEIRLTGKWLQDCGFKSGQEIEVSTEANKLVITIPQDSKEVRPSHEKRSVKQQL